MTDRTDTVLTVPHYSADHVRERIAKFTRWCVREGMPAPTVTEAPCTVRRLIMVDGVHGQQSVDVPGVAFTVATALLRLPGDWRLAAVVTPTDGGLVTTHAPGAPVVPADVIGDGTRCDHCECRRHRIETFAVVDGAGAFRMVGRNCVRAYLGVDPARWAAYLTGYAAALNTDDDDREPRDYAPGAGARWTDDVHRVLAAALFILRERGAYFKRDPDGKRPTPSTSSEAADLLDPYPVLRALSQCGAHAEAARLLARVRAFEVDSANAMRALDARRWAASVNAGTSPLDADMRAIASTGCVPPRSFGTTCWMAAAYLRANGELGEAKRDRPVRTDAHVGAEGERVDLPGCTVVHASQHDTAYGTSTLLVGYTADGRRWKCWYSGSGDVPAKGQRCDVRATIKANGTDDRDGTKVSTLTRAKFTSIADVDPAPAGDVAAAA